MQTLNKMFLTSTELIWTKARRLLLSLQGTHLCCMFWFGFIQRILECPQCSSISKGNESWRKYSTWTYIFISVWVLVLGLFGCSNLTVRAVVLTVVKRSTMVWYNHQLLDVTLETKKPAVRTSEISMKQIRRIDISLYLIQAM